MAAQIALKILLSNYLSLFQQENQSGLFEPQKGSSGGSCRGQFRLNHVVKISDTVRQY